MQLGDTLTALECYRCLSRIKSYGLYSNGQGAILWSSSDLSVLSALGLHTGLVFRVDRVIRGLYLH